MKQDKNIDREAKRIREQLDAHLRRERRPKDNLGAYWRKVARVTKPKGEV